MRSRLPERLRAVQRLTARRKTTVTSTGGVCALSIFCHPSLPVNTRRQTLWNAAEEMKSNGTLSFPEESSGAAEQIPQEQYADLSGLCMEHSLPGQCAGLCCTTRTTETPRSHHADHALMDDQGHWNRSAQVYDLDENGDELSYPAASTKAQGKFVAEIRATPNLEDGMAAALTGAMREQQPVRIDRRSFERQAIDSTHVHLAAFSHGTRAFKRRSAITTGRSRPTTPRSSQSKI